eukprot:m.363016 g.363016  ORF g.363016 m.363016 type:complete len:1207 (-) comp21320_c0_seq1:227-3847(-)
MQNPHAWEEVKENARPLRGGYTQKQLVAGAEGATVDEGITQEQRNFEAKVQVSGGSDPLNDWKQYIAWATEKSLARAIKATLVQDIVQRCVKKFLHEPMYKNDLRYLKICLKYADFCDDPLNIFSYLFDKGIGTQLALFWTAWAVVLENLGDFEGAVSKAEEGRFALTDQSQKDTLIQRLQDLKARIVLRKQKAAEVEDEDDLDAVMPQRSSLVELKKSKSGRVAHDRVAFASSKGPRGLSHQGTQAQGNVKPRTLQVFSESDETAPKAFKRPGTDSTWAAFPAPTVTSKENTKKAGKWTSKGFGGRSLAPVAQIHVFSDGPGGAEPSEKRAKVNSIKKALQAKKAPQLPNPFRDYARERGLSQVVEEKGKKLHLAYNPALLYTETSELCFEGVRADGWLKENGVTMDTFPLSMPAEVNLDAEYEDDVEMDDAEDMMQEDGMMQEQVTKAVDSATEAHMTTDGDTQVVNDVTVTKRLEFSAYMTPAQQHKFAPPSPTINTKEALADINAMFEADLPTNTHGTQYDDEEEEEEEGDDEGQAMYKPSASVQSSFTVKCDEPQPIRSSLKPRSGHGLAVFCDESATAVSKEIHGDENAPIEVKPKGFAVFCEDEPPSSAPASAAVVATLTTATSSISCSDSTSVQKPTSGFSVFCEEEESSAKTSSPFAVHTDAPFMAEQQLPMPHSTPAPSRALMQSMAGNASATLPATAEYAAATTNTKASVFGGNRAVSAHSRMLTPILETSREGNSTLSSIGTNASGLPDPHLSPVVESSDTSAVEDTCSHQSSLRHEETVTETAVPTTSKGNDDADEQSEPGLDKQQPEEEKEERGADESVFEDEVEDHTETLKTAVGECVVCESDVPAIQDAMDVKELVFSFPAPLPTLHENQCLTTLIPGEILKVIHMSPECVKLVQLLDDMDEADDDYDGVPCYEIRKVTGNLTTQQTLLNLDAALTALSEEPTCRRALSSIQSCVAIYQFQNATLSLQRSTIQLTMAKLLESYKCLSIVMEESLVLFYAIELLRTVEAIHIAGYTHGNLNGDSVRLRDDAVDPTEREQPWNRLGENSWNEVGIMVTDFSKAMQGFGTSQATQDEIGEYLQQHCDPSVLVGLTTSQVDYLSVALILYQMTGMNDVVFRKVPGDGITASASISVHLNQDKWTAAMQTLLNARSHTDVYDCRRLLEGALEQPTFQPGAVQGLLQRQWLRFGGE